MYSVTQFFFFLQQKTNCSIVSVMKWTTPKLGFPEAMTNDVVCKHVMNMTNVLWYLDGNKQKIMDRSRLTGIQYKASDK